MIIQIFKVENHVASINQITQPTPLQTPMVRLASRTVYAWMEYPPQRLVMMLADGIIVQRLLHGQAMDVVGENCLGMR